MPTPLKLILGVVIPVNALFVRGQVLDTAFLNQLFGNAVASNATPIDSQTIAASDSNSSSSDGDLSAAQRDSIVIGAVVILVSIICVIAWFSRSRPSSRNQTAVVWVNSAERAHQNVRTNIELQAWRSDSTVNEHPPPYFPTRSSPVEDEEEEDREHQEYQFGDFDDGNQNEHHSGLLHNDAFYENESTPAPGVDCLNHGENESEPPSYARVAAQRELRQMLQLAMQDRMSS